MNKGRVGEERGGKEMDGCPLTQSWSVRSVMRILSDPGGEEYAPTVNV
jgi:hypothetical protein